MRTRVLAGLLAGAGLFGQTQPERAGRVSFIYGSVSFRPGTTENWGSAAPNLPLSDGDHLYTDLGGQAEAQAGAATIHLAPQTGISIVHLDYSLAGIRITEGAINVRIARLDDGEAVEIVTPNA